MLKIPPCWNAIYAEHRPKFCSPSPAIANKIYWTQAGCKKRDYQTNNLLCIRFISTTFQNLCFNLIWSFHVNTRYDLKTFECSDMHLKALLMHWHVIRLFFVCVGWLCPEVQDRGVGPSAPPTQVLRVPEILQLEGGSQSIAGAGRRTGTVQRQLILSLSFDFIVCLIH